MGAASSKAKSVSDITKNVTTNIMMENASKCAANNNSSQELSFSDIKAIGCALDFSNISQKMKVSQDFSCMQSNSANSALENKLKTELEEKLSAEVSGQTIGKSESEVESIKKLTTNITNNVSIKNTAECVANNTASQKAKFGKIVVDCRGMPDHLRKVSFNNIGQTMVSAQVAKCIQSNAAASKAITELEEKLKTDASASTAGLEMPSMMILLAVGAFFLMQGASSMMPLLIMGVLALIAYVYFFTDMLKSDEGFDNNSMYVDREGFTIDESNFINKLKKLNIVPQDITSKEKAEVLATTLLNKYKNIMY